MTLVERLFVGAACEAASRLGRAPLDPQWLAAVLFLLHVGPLEVEAG